MDPQRKDVPVAYTHMADITGGKSGSPVMNTKGEIIGDLIIPLYFIIIKYYIVHLSTISYIILGLYLINPHLCPCLLIFYNPQSNCR